MSLCLGHPYESGVGGDEVLLFGGDLGEAFGELILVLEADCVSLGFGLELLFFRNCGIVGVEVIFLNELGAHVDGTKGLFFIFLNGFFLGGVVLLLVLGHEIVFLTLELNSFDGWGY